MKKTVIAAVASLALAGAAFAGSYEPMKDFKKEMIPPPPPTCFSDTEFQLDFFGTYNWTIDPNEYHDNAGGGVAANYIFARYFGIGADTNLFSGGANGVWQSSGYLILRYPIDDYCLAPYAIAGGGYQYDGHGEGTWHAGGGLEYRVVPHSVGLFTEGRYTWAEDNDTAQVRAGLRVVF